MSGMVDLWLVYSFIRRLATPFTEWEAFKLGIIDERGNVLRKRRDLRLEKERRAFGVFDVMVLNLKKVLEKVPGGQSRLASYAAALFLIREWNHFTDKSMLTEAVTDHQIEASATTFFADKINHLLYVEKVNTEKRSLDEKFQALFGESDVPVNNVGSGAVAGIGIGPDGEPGLTPAQVARHKKRVAGNKKRKAVD
jgi:hypothetical protein